MAKRKIPWGLIYIFAIIIAVIVFGIVNREFGNVFYTMKNLSPMYLAVAVLVTLIYFAFEGGISRMLMRSQGVPMKLSTALKISLIGLFYSYITPSATGGQPMQSAYLRRDKVPVGVSAAVLIIKFFCFQCAFFLCSLASFIFMYPKLHAETPRLIPLIILGLIINGGSIVFFPSLFVGKVLHTICRLAKWLVGKFKFLQRHFDLLSAIDKFEMDFISYKENFKEKRLSIIWGILLSIPQFVLQMSVIFFVFLSFGYTEISYFEVLSVQSLLQVSVSFMPMPGASGAQEIGFSSFFKNYFVNNDLYAAVMVWRFFTYYLVVIAGAVLVVADQLLYQHNSKSAAEE